MQYDFLKAFPKRMKNVGLYLFLSSNSFTKAHAYWVPAGFNSLHERMNMIYSVLLYIMEESLKEERCTIDEISAFIDQINSEVFKKPLTFEGCRTLADYIVNVILSNEGRPMYFACMNYETGREEQIHISYVANKIIYIDRDVRRTSYYLTDDGYSLLLGTLEVENNMKLSIQEMIFKMHLEKQSYDRALEDVKGIFNLMRIQCQKIQEAMLKIRRNALTYSVEDYARLLREDLDTIGHSSEKFRSYKESVEARVRELEEARIDLSSLTGQDALNLSNLQQIEVYLSRTLDEYQSILNAHFDLKSLYTSELEKITEMSLIRRFSFRSEIFERVLARPELLENADRFWRPLYNRDPDRLFDLGMIFEPQQLKKDESTEEVLETELFDEEAWKREQEESRERKKARYSACLEGLLEAAVSGKGSLSEILSGENSPQREKILTSLEIFKAVMVSLLKTHLLDVAALKRERADFIQDRAAVFTLSESVLDVLDQHKDWRIKGIEVLRRKDVPPVLIEEIYSEGTDSFRAVRCTDVSITIRGEE